MPRSPDECAGHLGGLRRPGIVGEEKIHTLLDQFSGCLGKSRDVPLRESDSDYKILVLPVAEFLETVTGRPTMPGVGPHASVSAPMRMDLVRSAAPALQTSSSLPASSRNRIK